MGRYDLSEAEWRLIEPLLPDRPRGVARVDDRRVINGIFYVLRTGSPWRDLPERYGPYTTVYNRYNRWAKAGVWLRMFEALAARSPQSMHLIDSSRELAQLIPRRGGFASSHAVSWLMKASAYRSSLVSR